MPNPLKRRERKSVKGDRFIFEYQFNPADVLQPRLIFVFERQRKALGRQSEPLPASLSPPRGPFDERVAEDITLCSEGVGLGRAACCLSREKY
jgi:hypothetical protein